METLKRCYLGWIHGLKYVQPVFLLAVRVLVGWGFILAGWGKLTNVDFWAGQFGNMGIPQPTVSVYLAGAAETLGGALLILGFASRISTIPLLFTMIVAYATADSAVFGYLPSDPNGFVKAFIAPGAPGTPYTVVVLMVLLFGPGLLSVDGLLKHLVFRVKTPAND
ncbi:MAG TPA: DoxX family protein [Gemmataceae bacterium]|nr:DoxX family protein [Gemmataceae bacterium]